MFYLHFQSLYCTFGTNKYNNNNNLKSIGVEKEEEEEEDRLHCMRFMANL